MMDSKERFTARVADYVKARPTYPREMLDRLCNAIGFAPSWRVADVGSGTGISTALFLEHGNDVHAVEPNAAMRKAAEERFADDPHFHSVAGDSSNTTLPDHSIDLVAAAQAFHWFDRSAFRAECVRILRPGRFVALIWNDRHISGTPFLDAYEKLLADFGGAEYRAVVHRNLTDKDCSAFFLPGTCQKISVPNQQSFDFELLKARLLSSSYVPQRSDSRHDPMLKTLREIFDRTQHNGTVQMTYDTTVHVGTLE